MKGENTVDRHAGRHSRSKRRWLVAVVAATAIAAVTVVAVAGHRTRAGHSADPTAQRSSTPAPGEPSAPPTSGSPRPSTVDHPAPLPTVAVTADPDTFAAAVTALVFGMDPAEHTGEDYRRVLLDAADPDLDPDARSDLQRGVAFRIPAPEDWDVAAARDTHASWRTTRVWTPDTWTGAKRAGQIPVPGWTARNVAGFATTTTTGPNGPAQTRAAHTLTVVMNCPTRGSTTTHCGLVMIGLQVLP